jgi:hypothetical protein
MRNLLYVILLNKSTIVAKCLVDLVAKANNAS